MRSEFSNICFEAMRGLVGNVFAESQRISGRSANSIRLGKPKVQVSSTAWCRLEGHTLRTMSVTRALLCRKPPTV